MSMPDAPEVDPIVEAAAELFERRGYDGADRYAAAVDPRRSSAGVLHDRQELRRNGEPFRGSSADQGLMDESADRFVDKLAATAMDTNRLLANRAAPSGYATDAPEDSPSRHARPMTSRATPPSWRSLPHSRRELRADPGLSPASAGNLAATATFPASRREARLSRNGRPTWCRTAWTQGGKRRSSCNTT